MSFPGGPRGPPLGMMPGQGYPMPPQVLGLGVLPPGVGVPVVGVPGMPPNIPPMGGQPDRRPKPAYQKFQPKSVQPAPTEEKPPTITVFVGNITDRASDGLIRAVLGKCGYIANWKRAHGANGVLQGFGFCDYSDPDSALRAIRVLNEMEIGDKKLMVKADAKTKENLAKFEIEQRKVSDYDAYCKRADIDLNEQVQQMLRVHASELKNKAPTETKERAPRTAKAPVQESMDDMELDEEKKSLITREIDKFRDTYKREEEDPPASSGRRDDKRRRSPSPNRKRDRRRSRSPRPRSPRRTPDRLKKSDKSQDRKTSGQKSIADDDEERYQKELRDKAKERERDLSRVERDKRREDKKIDDELDEEAYERRRHEKRLREKEAGYQEHLKQWEAREKRRAKEYAKEHEKEEERIDDEQKEGRRLREFFEDYDDERDDPKYYAGSGLTRRLRDRQRESDWDQRDRQKEKEEFDELKRKLLEEGHPDPEGEAKKQLLPPNLRLPDMEGVLMNENEDVVDGETTPPRQARSSREKNGRTGDEERTLKDQRETNEKNKETKRRHIRSLVEKIPNTKDELFLYDLDRSLVDENLIERRVRPWINKKILEFIGDEEAALVDFICQKILSGADAVGLLKNVSTVLDDDAENFIIKLWRLLIYEVEAKKLTLSNEETLKGSVS